MPNPNIKPRPENLTRAGMGQPRKGRSRAQITLPPEVLKRLDEIAEQQEWDRSYTIELFICAIAGITEIKGKPVAYDLQDLLLIAAGAKLE